MMSGADSTAHASKIWYAEGVKPNQLRRFWSKVVKTEDCWEWTGAKTGAGYGHVLLNYKNVYAHRLSYELLVGPIPEGLVIDHVCRNRGCINPEHLEPVTPRENVMRAPKHVVHGHERHKFVI